MKKIKLILAAAACFLIVNNVYANIFNFLNLNSTPGDISPQAFQMAMKAYNCAAQRRLTNKPIITIIDYSKPSNKDRLVVYDIAQNKVLFSDLVAHGSGSGGATATYFSNKPETHASSLGVFLTGNTYFGKHGYSLRLNGLSKGYNDNAAGRAIVVHAAHYATKEFAKIHTYLGRSWGCPAVSPTISSSLINTIKDRTVVFAYYPNSNVEANTPLLNCSV